MSAQNQIEIWAHYLTHEQGRSPATVREYLKDVRLLRSWLDAEDKPQHLRGRDWGELSAADLRAFLAQLSPAPRRFHRLVNSWRSFWRFLVRVQKLPGVQDITAELTTPKIPKRAPVKLTLEDVAKLLDVVYRDKSPQRGLRNWCIVAFLYGTGLRISEMLALKFSDIEYQDGSPVAVRVIGKGDKERRVPLSQTAQAALMRWLRERKTHGNPVTPWVWSPLAGKRYGQPMQARTIEKMLDTAAARAGLDPATVSPHKLRHTFATTLLNNGRTLDEIKELLGHENIQTTMIYAQTDTKRVAAAAAALPDVVGLAASVRPS